MPQKKLFAALLVAASALLMLGMSNENQIHHIRQIMIPKVPGRRPTMDWPMCRNRLIFSSSIFIICSLLIRLCCCLSSVPISKLPNIPAALPLH